MKRLLIFMLALVLAVSSGACSWGAQIIYVDGQEHEDETDDDGNIITPIYRDTIANALDAANTMADEDSSYEEVVVLVTANRGGNLEETITLDSDTYSSLSSITISGDVNLTAPENARHFILSTADQEITFNSVRFAGNNGGGVRVTAGNVTFTNVTFSRIDAAENSEEEDNNGGGVSVTGGEVTFTGITDFTGNTASNGGALSFTGGTVTFTGPAVFTRNTAANGGAVYSACEENITFSDTVSFENNTAAANGGAMYVSGTQSGSSDDYYDDYYAMPYMNMKSEPVRAAASVTVNTAGHPAASFTGNTGALGGALYVTTGGGLVMTGEFNFDNNTSSTNGGAICVDGTGLINGTNSTSSFTSNRAGTYTLGATDPSSGSSGFGGAIYFDSTGTSNLGAIICDNNESTTGGAVYVNAGTINFNGRANFGTTNGNRAYSGGALYLNGGSTNFLANVSFDRNTALNDGGALYTAANGTETLNFTTPVSFTSNKANNDNGNTGDGGAIWWGMTMSEFSNAFSVAGNGGVSFTGNSTGGTSTTINLPNNAGNGGAIYFAGSDALTINANSNLSFSDNTAYNSGGAIYTDTANVTLSGITVDVKNTALFGRGGFIRSYSGSVTIENSSISNQEAYSGGVVCAGTITITSSDLSSNTALTLHGGAVYAPLDSTLTITGTIFSSNRSISGNGGAVYADGATVSITDTYFTGNTSPSNGGAIDLENSCVTTLNTTEFENNRSTRGGAIRAYGTIQINTSLFRGNYGTNSGGAVFFSQYGSNGVIGMRSSQFEANIAGAGRGGALYLEVDLATIDSCTFNRNSAINGSEARGGAVFFDISRSTSAQTSSIENSTFTANQVSDGTDNSYGGAIALYGTVTLRSNTFTMGNSASNRGGGVFIGGGNIAVSGTIIAGNSAPLGSDIWSDSESYWTSAGFNRIGIYGTGTGNTSWLAHPAPATDRENSSWTTATFYSENELADNIVSGTIPPLIGSSRSTAGQIRLQTLMLSEAEDLPLSDRATNVIPYTPNRYSFPQYDQRGVDRRANGTDLDIGPVYFGGTVPGDIDNPVTTYTITGVTMSGIPNTLRSIGQTASLIARVRYSNGRTAFGGTGTGEEPVTWESSNQNIIRIDQNGNLTALATTPNNNYVTISVRTNRYTAGGVPATDSRPVRVTGQYSNMNISSVWQTYFSTYIQELAEHDISLQLADVSDSQVRASVFQRAFKAKWDVERAEQVTRLDASAPSFAAPSGYTAADGLRAAKTAGVNITFNDRTAGDLFPLIYSWNFSGDEIKALLGYDLTNKNLTASLAEELFSKLRVDFQNSTRTWPVLGAGGVSVSEAISSNVFSWNKTDGDKGAHIELTAYLANVASSGSEDGPQLIGSGTRKLLIVPDGVEDGAIYGTMWMASTEAGQTPNAPVTPAPSGGNDGDGGGGGGGCDALRLGVIAAAVLLLRRRQH